MKKRKNVLSFLLLSLIFLFSVFAIGGCGTTEEDSDTDTGTESGDETDTVLLEFSTTDDSTTIDSKYYTLAFVMNTDGTAKLTGTCTGEAESSSDDVFSSFRSVTIGESEESGTRSALTETSDDSSSEEESSDTEDSEDEEEDDTDYSIYDFTIDGTWTEESGYGYVLWLDDDKNDYEGTTIHINYNTTSGRHYFYYYIQPYIEGTMAESATSVYFYAKDSSYMKTLASDYAIYEERTCEYMFCGGQESGSNLQSGWMYLMPEGEEFAVVVISGTSNSLSYTAGGSWTEDTENHVITVTIDDETYTTDYCDTVGREGYRLTYSDMTLYASCDTDNYTWDLYTSTDFEGETLYTLEGQGNYAAYTVELTEKGYANVITDDEVVYTTSYTLDGTTITIDDSVSTLEDGVVSIELTWTVTTTEVIWTTTTEYTGTFSIDADALA